jgi:hypothetical protein
MGLHGVLPLRELWSETDGHLSPATKVEICLQAKGEVIPVLNYVIGYYTMKSYGEWKFSATILDLGTWWICVVSLTPVLLLPPVPIEYEAGLAPERIWTLRRKKISLSYGGSKPGSRVSIRATLSRFLYGISQNQIFCKHYRNPSDRGLAMHTTFRTIRINTSWQTARVYVLWCFIPW